MKIQSGGSYEAKIQNNYDLKNENIILVGKPED
jgi:hypothetical protein